MREIAFLFEEKKEEHISQEMTGGGSLRHDCENNESKKTNTTVSSKYNESRFREEISQCVLFVRRKGRKSKRWEGETVVSAPTWVLWERRITTGETTDKKTGDSLWGKGGGFFV